MSSPIKPNIKSEIIPIIFLFLCLILSFYFYSNFPDRVAIHWNADGEIDGYSGRAFAAFFFPLLNIAIYLLMLFVPYADPRKKNYKKFENVYHIVKGALAVFLTAVYLVVGLNGLNYTMPINIVIPAGAGLLFIVIGTYLGKIKPNWFLGIRTPWTLSSDMVWEKTHRFGSKVFLFGGILIILSAFFPHYFGWFIGLFILMIFSVILYSYLIYKG